MQRVLRFFFKDSYLDSNPYVSSFFKLSKQLLFQKTEILQKLHFVFGCYYTKSFNPMVPI